MTDELSLERLEEMIESGQSSLASAQILERMTAGSLDPGQCADLVNIVMLIPDYELSRRLFGYYEDATGRVLRADFSLADILKEEALNQGALASDIEFRRMTFKERGHFGNRFMWNPVVWTALTERYLLIKRRFGGKQNFVWSEVHALLVKEQKTKAYGAYSHGRFTRATLTLRTPEEDFVIDVSSNFPDLKRSKRFLAVLADRIEIEQIS